MSDKNYLKLIVAHFGIGLLIFFFPFLAKVYTSLIVVISLYFIIKNRNKSNEALYTTGYIIGSEVFLRSIYGIPIHEFGKYFGLLFILLGIYFNGIHHQKNPYWIYLLLLIPASIISMLEISTSNTPVSISFNISGPISLGIYSLYTYKRNITYHELNTILLAIGMPILSYVFYLFLKCPIDNFVIGSTESNYILSGGFSPNQTATILGLGVFIFTTRFFLIPSSNKIKLVNIFLIIYIFYRTLLTFSRGGAITGIIINLTLLFCLLIIYAHNKSLKIKISGYVFFLIAVFFLTSFQTNNLLWMRYANQNPNGLQKSYDVNGRKDIALSEIQLFKKNPLLGVGVGESTKIRKSKTGTITNSHSEITRMLAEHGLFGLLSLSILIITPILLFLKNRQNFYMVCFFLFWLLTINHSAMRIAAPSFIYALALFNLRKEEN